MVMEKKTHYCILCGLDEKKNRKNPHHVMPRRYSKNNKLRVWLCRFCHMIMHKAEDLALCKLPKSKEEYDEWRQDVIKEDALRGN